MVKSGMNIKSIVYPLLGTIITFALLFLYAIQLSVPVISDETITMANVALLNEYDWSLMIASLGGYYYRYLQPLLTFPFFAWLDDPDLIYRVTMVLHAALQVSIVPVVYIICQKYLKVESRIISLLIGEIVCLIPAQILYIFYYRGDLLLAILPWHVLLLLLETVDAANEKNRKKRVIGTIISALWCVIGYMAHTRGLVILIALLFTAFIVQVTLKKKSFYWPIFLVVLFILMIFDSKIGGMFKAQLYAVSGLNANAIESIDVASYFNIFSYDLIKSIFMLGIGWLYTLIVSNQGLVLIGIFAICIVAKKIFGSKSACCDMEKVILIYTLLIFVGYFAIGAIHFKWDYLFLSTGELTRRSDSIIYDRYSICGASMVIFWALYVLCCKKEWVGWKFRVSCIIGGGGVIAIAAWKILPIVLKYPGYIYNTIILNTFQNITDASRILSGEYYEKEALILITISGIILMFIVLGVSMIKRKYMPYMLIGIILVSDLLLIQVNYIKIRKASNDYVIEATQDVVDFMRSFEGEITDEFPYILKGGLSGVKIQFYQSQLMSYRMFGKKQEEQLDIDNYFIISKHGDINLTWYEEDYYLFENFDYENAEYDIVYVKGEQLAQRLEEVGYRMVKYKAVDN